MSRILEKLKRKSLFEELSEKFPRQVVNPYGLVVIIPSKRFENQWKKKLEAEGLETFSSSFDEKVCFFVRRKKQNSPSSVIEESSIQKVEGDSKPSPVKEKKPLTPEQKAKVKRLYGEGVCGKEIAKKLGCSVQTIGGLVRHLSKPKEKHEGTKSNDPDIVRELLSACSLLYPSHPQTCRFLLKEITVRMAVGSNE